MRRLYALVLRIQRLLDRPVTTYCCPRHAAMARGRRVGGPGW